MTVPYDARQTPLTVNGERWGFLTAFYHFEGKNATILHAILIVNSDWTANRGSEGSFFAVLEYVYKAGGPLFFK